MSQCESETLPCRGRWPTELPRIVSCNIPCMATKTITLELDAYEMLKAARRPGESFSATVRRARFGPSDSTGKTILASMDELTVRPADREAVKYWSSAAAEGRTTTPLRLGSRE